MDRGDPVRGEFRPPRARPGRIQRGPRILRLPHADLIRWRGAALKLGAVPSFRIAQAAELLGVSDDTVRRWIDSGRLSATTGSGPRMVDGAVLARFAQQRAAGEPVARSPV